MVAWREYSFSYGHHTIALCLQDNWDDEEEEKEDEQKVEQNKTGTIIFWDVVKFTNINLSKAGVFLKLEVF